MQCFSTNRPPFLYASAAHHLLNDERYSLADFRTELSNIERGLAISRSNDRDERTSKRQRDRSPPPYRRQDRREDRREERPRNDVKPFTPSGGRLHSKFPNENMKGKKLDKEGKIVCGHCLKFAAPSHFAQVCSSNPNRDLRDGMSRKIPANSAEYFDANA